jgi:predicted porin
LSNSLEKFAMKKTLIALAALASTAAFAQSAVTLYGVVDMGYNTNKLTDGATVTSKKAGLNSIQSGSRLGVKGTEDLGGGMKGNFLVEMGTTPDEATHAMSNRQSYVGVSGNFGTVNLGRMYTLAHGVQGAYDTNGNATAAGWLGSATSLVRASNLVAYTTPSFNGFSASAGVGFGEAEQTTASTNKSGNVTTLSVSYANGPLTLQAATETVKLTKLAVTLPGGSAATDLSNALADRKANSFGGSYDLGVAKITALRTTAKAGSAADAGEFNTNNFGVSVPMGALTLAATVSNGDYVDSGAAKVDVSGYQLGATYALSKRTNLYTFAGQSKDKTATNAGKAETFAVGVRHTF